MRYRVTIEKRDDAWVYVIGFGKDTPMSIDEIMAFSDDTFSAEDFRGVRHHVYFKESKIASIHLHDATGILPWLDPDRQETLRMPAMNGIMFGDPPVPTLWTNALTCPRVCSQISSPIRS